MNSPVLKNIDVLIIGGGPAGLAAAVRLYEKGIRDILILEREKQAGGILRQCIHDGFGLTRFGMSMSGPEYADRFLQKVKEYRIPMLLNTSVIRITPDRVVTAASPAGLLKYQAGAVILAMGCREKTRGALAIPGERPAGVFTAGVAQAYMNLYNRMPAKEAVILGSGDIGMIMARRLTLEGAHVRGVYELMPYAAGLPRNVQQCLKDYNIPLYLNTTVTKIHGDRRLEAVTVSEVDAGRRPVPGTERRIECDTLILSVGLIPENELSLDAGVLLDPGTRGASVDENYQTNIPGIYAAGNVLHVHDLVDFVSLEAEQLAEAVAARLRNQESPECPIRIRHDRNIGHTVPDRVSGTRKFRLSLRVNHPMENVRITVLQGENEIASRRMKKAVPAEMIQLEIGGDKLVGSTDVEVKIL